MPPKREKCVTLSDFEKVAFSKLPKNYFHYVAGAAGDESDFTFCREFLDSVRLVNRVLRDTGSCDTALNLFGTRCSFPLIVAPTAYLGSAYPKGEIAMARATKRFGSIMTLSTLACESIGKVKRETDAPLWLQLFIYKDRNITRAMIERAADTGCLGLVVTVDQPTVGIRYRDRRNQFKSPSNFRLQNVLTEAEFKALRPREGAVQRFLEQQRQAAVTWKDIEWLRSISKMPVILKGILSPTDAKLAASAGASGIIVSNHGGRQLDALVSPVAALPAVREAVGRDFPLIVDGGIRSGSDIIRCLCLGANAVMIGRPAVWGLAADGESGALAVLRLLAEEFTKGIAILGANSLAELGREYIFRHSAFSYPKTF